MPRKPHKVNKKKAEQTIKHEIYIDGLAAMRDGESPWRCRCGYIYPPTPEWAIETNNVFVWIELLKKEHEST